MIRRRRRVLGLALFLVTAVACKGGEKATGPAVATPSLTLSHNRAPAGSPLELTYKFVVAPGATFAEDYRVFAHVVDSDDEKMWDDDHNPPVPTSQWKPGQTVEYTRTIFVPVFPYVGDATIRLGLHSVKDQKRLALTGEDVGQNSYVVAHMQLLPQTDNLFTVSRTGGTRRKRPRKTRVSSGSGPRDRRRSRSRFRRKMRCSTSMSTVRGRICTGIST